ncbi:AI-2E family transporter, partial [Longimicrobium sp.]|uniref:AI-2E family transporter n=1 Tax=Longimicrobium sp. TaxID=2029185 RepID=UPI002E368CAD
MAFLQTQRQRAAALVAALGIAIAIALTPFASGLLGIAVLYVICAPAHRRLSRHVPPRVSALLVLAVALLLVLLPLGVVVGIVVSEAPDTIAALQQNAILGRLETLRIGGLDVGAQMAQAGGTVVAWLSAQALAFFGSAARGTLSLVIAFFGLYYLLLYPGAVWYSVRDFLPFSDAAADHLRDRFHSVTEATLVGTLFTAIVQGTLIGLGFWLVGLPSAAFWGVITALVSVLPMLGSALVWVPGVAVLVVSERWGMALVLAAIGFFAANVDNVIRLIVFKRVSDIHPMATLIGAFAGLKYFGLLGVLLGPLAIAYFFEMLKMYRMDYVVG